MPSGPKVKRLLKKGIKETLLRGGGWARTRGPHARILTYHSVGRRRHEMNVTPEAFGAQMAWLAANVDVVPLDTAVAGRHGVALTFDDGYRDNLTHAAPILEEMGMAATVFMVAGRAGGLLTRESDPETDKILSWQELGRLAEAGWQVGAHTLSHSRLTRLNEENQRREIRESKARIEEHLGRPVRAFAYPFGSALDYDETSVRLVREAGFAYAVSNRYGLVRPGGAPWALRRIWVDASDSLETFAAKVEGRLDLLEMLDTGPGIALRRVLNRGLGTSGPK